MWGVVARWVNAKWFLQTSHKARQWFVTIGMAFGFMLISWCVMGTQNGQSTAEYKFWISLVASVIIGVTSALGECNVVALMKGFPSQTIGYFGSGTGFAGICGTSMLLVLSALGMRDWQIYMTAAPTMIPYIYCCLWVIDMSHKYRFVPEIEPKEESEVSREEREETEGLMKQNAKVQNITQELTSSDNSPMAVGDRSVDDDVSSNLQLDCDSFMMVMKKAGLTMSNLSMVYFLEYSITTAFGIAAVNKMCEGQAKCTTEFIWVEAFTILYFCYQVGVFLSRSSLQLFVVDRVWIVTLLQLVNFVVFFLNAFYLFIGSIYVLFTLMVWVGCMGGCSYVNVIYKIQRSDKLKRTEKELAVMILMMFNDFGIFAASLFALILNLTVFKVPS